MADPLNTAISVVSGGSYGYSLKSRFAISFGISTPSFSLPDLDVFVPSAQSLKKLAYYTAFTSKFLLQFDWNYYLESVSSPAKYYDLKQIKVGDIYDYVKSFEATNDIVLTFVLLDNKIIDMINAWMSLIHSPNGFGYYEDYAKFEMTLKMLTIDPIEDCDSINFFDIYPVELSFNELDSESTNLTRLNVRFKYRSFRLKSENSNLIDNLASLGSDLI